MRENPNPAPARGIDYGPSGQDTSGSCANPAYGWRCVLYTRGLTDGENALNLARAYAITGLRAYGNKAKTFLLAWARTYNRPNPTVGHDIAEPAGFMLKGFLAYDLTRALFDVRERREFTAWAKLFVPDGERRADYQRDHPGIPDQTYNGDTSNWQSFGNSAAFSRALAVTAAAVVGGNELKRVLAWNWSHTTREGHDNGWTTLIDGEIIDGTGGETFEGRARHDIGYGLLGTSALLLIAHIAQHSGFKPNLFTYTTPSGNSILSPYVFYGPYLTFTKPWPTSDGAYRRRDEIAATFRAALEWGAGYLTPALRRVVTYGGSSQRGANFDPYIGLYNTLNVPR